MLEFFLLALVFLSLKRPCLELTLFPVLQLESGIFLKLNSVTSRKEAEEKLETLAANEYGIIYITEAMAAECEKIIEKFQEQLFPAVIRIPGVSGNTGDGVEGVKKSVEQAVGSDILFGSET